MRRPVTVLVLVVRSGGPAHKPCWGTHEPRSGTFEHRDGAIVIDIVPHESKADLLEHTHGSVVVSRDGGGDSGPWMIRAEKRDDSRCRFGRVAATPVLFEESK